MAVVQPRTDVEGDRDLRGRHALQMSILLALACLGTLVVALHAATGQPAARSRQDAPGRTSTVAPRRTPWPVPHVRRVVTLGDSVAAGTSCSCPPFADLVAQHLTATLRAPVSSTNLSVDGETSSQLLQSLGTDATRRQLHDAGVVLVTVGANDLESLPVRSGCASLNPSCYAPAVASLRGLLGKAITQIKASTGGPTVVVLVGYWNVFLDGVVGRGHGPSYVANSDLLTRAVDAAIQSAATSGRALYLDTNALFKQASGDDDTHLLASDGDHPNAAGHRLIAGGIVTLLRAAGCPC